MSVTSTPSPFATRIDPAKPLPPLEGDALDSARDRWGWPIREISQGLVNVEALRRTYRNEAGFERAKEVALSALTDIARLYGTDIRSLLLAYDLERAVHALNEQLVPHLSGFLPIIAHEHFAEPTSDQGTDVGPASPRPGLEAAQSTLEPIGEEG